MDALALHRLQFAFTITYHYLFPQLTMGLTLLIVILLVQARRGRAEALPAARFWLKILGLNFVMGVVTGIPMEFQFGTNWSRFAASTGNIIGQSLAMEGMFAFFIESSFLYLLLFEERRIGPKWHLASAVAVCVGSWTSGYFIVVTNAWMQHPVGYELLADGSIVLQDIWAYLTNPWAFVEYTHTMLGSLLTASTAMAATGAFYRLRRVSLSFADRSLALGTSMGLFAALAVAFPAGDLQAKLVAKHQPVAFAAMEGHFHSDRGSALVLIGQPNMVDMRLDNPVAIPRMLSVMTHMRWDSEIQGLDAFPRDTWPDNIPLLYYAYHVMVGLGTLLIALFSVAVFLRWRGRLNDYPSVLWALMLAWPFPYIANTAGWLTAELGRQPWLVYGLLKTSEGSSQQISAGNLWFGLLGFFGLYSLLSLLYIVLTAKILLEGPATVDEPHLGGQPS